LEKRCKEMDLPPPLRRDDYRTRNAETAVLLVEGQGPPPKGSIARAVYSGLIEDANAKGGHPRNIHEMIAMGCGAPFDVDSFFSEAFVRDRASRCDVNSNGKCMLCNKATDAMHEGSIGHRSKLRTHMLLELLAGPAKGVRNLDGSIGMTIGVGGQFPSLNRESVCHYWGEDVWNLGRAFMEILKKTQQRVVFKITSKKTVALPAAAFKKAKVKMVLYHPQQSKYNTEHSVAVDPESLPDHSHTARGADSHELAWRSTGNQYGWWPVVYFMMDVEWVYANLERWVADELVRLMWVTCIHQMLDRPIWAWPITPAPPLPALDTWDEAMAMLAQAGPAAVADQDMGEGVWEEVSEVGNYEMPADTGGAGGSSAGSYEMPADTGAAGSSGDPPMSFETMWEIVRNMTSSELEAVASRARRG
jgi:hypothetical protein